MKNFIKSILFSLIALTLINCGDDAVVNSYKESNTKGTLGLTIKDAETESAIAEVEISWRQAGKVKTATTDSTGFVLIEKLEVGSYVFTISKDGYASTDQSIYFDAGETNIPILGDLNGDVFLSKADISVSGNVLIEDIKGVVTKKEGAKVDLEITSGSFSKTIYTETTDANGSFAFENLPTMASYEISVRNIEENGIVYSETYSPSYSNKKSGENIVITTPFLLEPTATAITATDFTDEIEATDDVSISFTTPIDTDEIGYEDIYVSDAGKKIAITYSFNADKTILTISPVSGSWTDDEDYTLNLSLKSVSGSTYSDTHLFNVGSTVVKPTKVANLAYTITYSTFGSDLELTWDLVTGVDGYEIYVKYPDSDEYVFQANTSSIDNDYIISDIDYGTEIDDTQEISIKVYSYTNKHGLSDAATVTAQGTEFAPPAVP